MSNNQPVWRCFPLGQSLGEHGKAWDALNKQLFNDHPLLRSVFINGLLRHFGDGREQLGVLRQENETLAMCVLRRESALRWATFRPAQAQIGCMLLSDVALAKSLLDELPGWPLTLDLMCCDALLTNRLARIGLQLRFPHASTMSVRLQGSFDSYWRTRSTSLRKSMRQWEKRAEVIGAELRFRRVENMAAMAEAVRRYGELEVKGWKGQEGTAIAPGSVQARFYTELMEREAERGAAQVHELWVGDTLSASRLLVTGPLGMVILKTTFDESLARIAPGRLLLKSTLNWAFDHLPGQTVEFYTDATRDQLKWATDWRAICDVRIHRNLIIEMLASARRLLRAVPRSLPTAVDLCTVDVLHNLTDLPTDVRALLTAAELEHGLQAGPDWYRLLGEYVLAAGHEIRIFVLRMDRTAVAVLPLMKARGSTGAVQALVSYYTAYFAPAMQPWVKAEHLVPLLRAVRNEWPQVHTLTLAPLKSEGREFATLRLAFELAGMVTFRFFRFGNWTLRCWGQSWTAYLSTRGSQLRNNLSRASKRFAAQGGRFEIVTEPADLDRALDAYEAVYQKSWKQAEPFPAFIRALAHQCAAQNQLRVGIAWLADRPVAAQVWLTVHGRAEIVKLAYDERVKALSVGTLLTAQMLQLVLDTDKVREVDYLIGDDAYKRLWMNQRSERWGIVGHIPTRWRGVTGILRQLTGAALAALSAAGGRRGSRAGRS